MKIPASQLSSTAVVPPGPRQSFHRAVDVCIKAETFLRDCKSILELCPGYRPLTSQLDLSVPFLQTVIAQHSVDGFRIQRAIELLRSLHTFLLDESTRCNIDRSGVGVMDWARLVLQIPEIMDALKQVLRRPLGADITSAMHL